MLSTITKANQLLLEAQALLDKVKLEDTQRYLPELRAQHKAMTHRLFHGAEHVVVSAKGTTNTNLDLVLGSCVNNGFVKKFEDKVARSPKIACFLNLRQVSEHKAQHVTYARLCRTTSLRPTCLRPPRLRTS